MGDMAEHLEYTAFRQEAEAAERLSENMKDMDLQYAAGVLKWTTKDEIRLPLSEMSRRHISNTIGYLNSKIDKMGGDSISSKWVEIFERELDSRK